MAATPSEPAKLYVVEQPGRIFVLEKGEAAAVPRHPRPRRFRLLRAGTAVDGVSPEATRRTAASTSTTPTSTATPASSSSAPTAGRRGSARPASCCSSDQPYLEPQRRAAPVRARREALRRHGGRRERGRSAEPRADAAASRLAKLLRTNPLAVDWEIGRLRPAQPLALLVRPQDGRPLHRRRRAERPRGDRLPAAGSAAGELRLGPVRGKPHVRRATSSSIPPTPLVFPIHEYGHGEGCSVTGGYVYRGKDVPAAVGRYFFGDYCSGTVWSLRVVERRSDRRAARAFDVSSLSSFGEGARGELYLVSHEGAIYRLAPLDGRSRSERRPASAAERRRAGARARPGPPRGRRGGARRRGGRRRPARAARART